MQNILTFRFSNSVFEPIWNRKHIEFVEINLFEKGGIEGRGAYYQEAGALRDVGQNHMLVMLALIAMEKPKSLSGAAICSARVKVLKQLTEIKPKDLSKKVVRAQYEDFHNEEKVHKASSAETFFSLQVDIKNSRWRGVPFYLSSGKALNNSRVEIKIHFKDIDPKFFLPEKFAGQEKNILTFRIQPHEGISLLFWTKVPGFEKKIESRELSFSYKDHQNEIPDAYEKILFDALQGDQTLFTSTEEVQAAWKFITPILEQWHKVPIKKYKMGSDPSDLKLG
ncbi:hypothetical protein KW783_04245 [Candidatus Parcubacteria bacterium]|nr:hypothetical protein [Candidatus Parcubacteria bacterium]